MFRAQRDLSLGGVFHFVTTAITKNRGPGCECAGTAGSAVAAADAHAWRRESP
jgi:hypothetical protein